MIPTDRNSGAMSTTQDGELRRRRALLFGFYASLIGLPIGLGMGLPVVWGLAAIGIAIGGTKLFLRRHLA